MSRSIKALSGATIAFLGALAVGQWYLDKPQIVTPNRKMQPAIQPKEPVLSADQYIDDVTPALEAGDQGVIASVIDDLESTDYAKAVLSPKSRETMAKAAVGVVLGSQADDALKERLVQFTASRVGGDTAKAMIMTVMEEGPDNLRQAAFNGLGHSGVQGKSVYLKVQELAAKGFVPQEKLPGLLARTGGKKAVEPIIGILKSTDSYGIVSECSVALQYFHDPALMGVVLGRLDEVGRIDKSRTLPWINSGLFAKYMETASGDDLKRGLKVIGARPKLAKKSLTAIQTALQAQDGETRQIAASTLRKAVVGRAIDKKTGSEMLNQRLTAETEPALRAELTSGLEQVRSLAD